jgi:hypothetical protein
VPFSLKLTVILSSDRGFNSLECLVFVPVRG